MTSTMALIMMLATSSVWANAEYSTTSAQSAEGYSADQYAVRTSSVSSAVSTAEFLTNFSVSASNSPSTEPSGVEGITSNVVSESVPAVDYETIAPYDPDASTDMPDLSNGPSDIKDSFYSVRSAMEKLNDYKKSLDAGNLDEARQHLSSAIALLTAAYDKVKNLQSTTRTGINIGTTLNADAATWRHYITTHRTRNEEALAALDARIRGGNSADSGL